MESLAGSEAGLQAEDYRGSMAQEGPFRRGNTLPVRFEKVREAYPTRRQS